MLLGFGIGCYFALPFEPDHDLILLAVLLPLLALWPARHARGRLFPFLCLLAAFAVGIGVASLRTAWTEAPVLEKERIFRLSGVVTMVEPFADGPRVRLEKLRYSGRPPPPDHRPLAVRIKLKRNAPAPAIGVRLALLAKLRPPPRAAWPGGYDFARAAWFRRLGAVGFALSNADIMPQAETDRPGLRFRLILALESFRASVGQHIRATVPGQAGAIAEALITGARGGVSAETLRIMRDSGLAHLLAISGLHLGLVAGAVFFLCRAMLVRSEYLALHYPIKKWAALAALVTAFAYLLLAGATVPTRRAFLMTGLALLAVMLDRQAISLRLVAVAAAVVLLLQPESLLGASFQMSFAAVTALVAVYEAWRRSGWRAHPLLSHATHTGGAGGDHSRFMLRILFYFLAISVTTIVASLATAPFAWHHFGRIAHYGLLANLLAIPLMAFWIMPTGLFAVLLMPVGLEALPLSLMARGIDVLLWLAAAVADLDGAARQVVPLADWGLYLVVGGGLWLILRASLWRFLGLPVILAGLILPPLWQRPPHIMLAESGRLAALAPQSGSGVGEEAGELWLSAPGREKFAAMIWARQSGLAVAGDWQTLQARLAAAAETDAETDAPPDAPKGATRLACDSLSCRAILQGYRIAFSRDPRSLAEDCRTADIVIADIYLPRRACDADLVIDPPRLYREGTHLITLTATGMVLQTVGEAAGKRPWARARP